MNVGIITDSKKIDFDNLPSNTYLVFYLKNTNDRLIDNLVNYLVLNNCKCLFINLKKEISISSKKIKILTNIQEIKEYSNTKKIITYGFKSKKDKTSFFEECNSFRKDNKPKETIKIIKSILKNNGFSVKEKGLRINAKGTYSIRLELNNGKGSNGKGTSLSKAKASAYAELIERLQSNMLNKKRIETKKIDKNNKLYDSLLSGASSYYKNKFFKLDNIYFNVLKTKNIKKDIEEEIPINAICSFCHTNGLASGNSYEEAINQAIFEILERFCYQKCLKNNIMIKNINFPDFLLTKSNKLMLKKFKDLGFNYYIKDCSLGKYPVIGFLLVDKNNNYTFTMGSDTSFNIALSRCITEMMQGVNFKELKNKMVPNITLQSQVDKYGKKYYSYNWLKCFNNNNGYLTTNFFSNEYINISTLHFKDYLTTNKEVFHYLKELIDEDIYIIDYNVYSFNTYRVYIPYMTTVDCYDEDDLIINKNYNLLKSNYTNILKSSKEDKLFFIDTFLKINYNLKYDELIKPSDLFHINESSDYYKLDFTSLLIVLCLAHSKKDDLLKLLKYKIDNFPLNQTKLITYKIIVNCITNKNIYDVFDKKIYNYISNIVNDPLKYLKSLNPKYNNNDLLIDNKKV